MWGSLPKRGKNKRGGGQKEDQSCNFNLWCHQETQPAACWWHHRYNLYNLWFILGRNSLRNPNLGDHRYSDSASGWMISYPHALLLLLHPPPPSLLLSSPTLIPFSRIVFSSHYQCICHLCVNQYACALDMCVSWVPWMCVCVCVCVCMCVICVCVKATALRERSTMKGKYVSCPC